MFCDARSTPPRVAAVLFVNGRIFWADMEPDESILKAFRPRGDNHIMSLEILSIALGFPFPSSRPRCHCCVCVPCKAWRASARRSKGEML